MEISSWRRPAQMSWSLLSLSFRQSQGEDRRGSSDINTITLAWATQDRIYCKASWYALWVNTLLTIFISETLRASTTSILLDPLKRRFWRCPFGEDILHQIPTDKQSMPHAWSCLVYRNLIVTEEPAGLPSRLLEAGGNHCHTTVGGTPLGSTHRWTYG